VRNVVKASSANVSLKICPPSASMFSRLCNSAPPNRQADYEHERPLTYRVMVAFEAVGAIVLVREIVLRLT
jgi:hypothetical protein